jgi:hypothetical protein
VAINIVAGTERSVVKYFNKNKKKYFEHFIKMF